MKDLFALIVAAASLAVGFLCYSELARFAVEGVLVRALSLGMPSVWLAAVALFVCFVLLLAALRAFFRGNARQEGRA